MRDTIKKAAKGPLDRHADLYGCRDEDLVEAIADAVMNALAKKAAAASTAEAAEGPTPTVMVPKK